MDLLIAVILSVLPVVGAALFIKSKFDKTVGNFGKQGAIKLLSGVVSREGNLPKIYDKKPQTNNNDTSKSNEKTENNQNNMGNRIRRFQKEFQDSKEGQVFSGVLKVGKGTALAGTVLATKAVKAALKNMKKIKKPMQIGLNKVYKQVKPKVDSVKIKAKDALEGVASNVIDKFPNQARKIKGYVTNVKDKAMTSVPVRKITGFAKNVKVGISDKYKDIKSAGAEKLLEVTNRIDSSELMKGIKEAGYKEIERGITKIIGAATAKSFFVERFKGAGRKIRELAAIPLEERKRMIALRRARNINRQLEQLEGKLDQIEEQEPRRFTGVKNGIVNLAQRMNAQRERNREKNKELQSPTNIGIGMVFNDVNLEQQVSRFSLAEGSVAKALSMSKMFLEKNGLNNRQKSEVNNLMQMYRESQITKEENGNYIESARNQKYYQDIFTEIVKKTTGDEKFGDDRLKKMYDAAQIVAERDMRNQERRRIEAAEIAREKFNLDEENLKEFNRLIDDNPEVGERINNFLQESFKDITKDHKDEILKDLKNEIIRDPNSAKEIIGEKGAEKLQKSIEENINKQNSIVNREYLNIGYKLDKKFERENPEYQGSVREARRNKEINREINGVLGIDKVSDITKWKGQHGRVEALQQAKSERKVV